MIKRYLVYSNIIDDDRSAHLWCQSRDIERQHAVELARSRLSVIKPFKRPTRSESRWFYSRCTVIIPYALSEESETCENSLLTRSDVNWRSPVSLRVEKRLRKSASLHWRFTLLFSHSSIEYMTAFSSTLECIAIRYRIWDEFYLPEC